jgi:peptide deformylase
MSILRVARMGNPVLRDPARPVDPSELRTPAVQKLIDDMIQTMVEYQGIGLAGPQVHERRRIFVAGVENGDDPMRLTVVVNPELTLRGDPQVEDWEGCLSIPDLRGKVPRAPEVELNALDRHGEPLRLTAHDFAARVIQHETDHLDGVLFVDRMRSFDTLTHLDEFSRFWTTERD